MLLHVLFFFIFFFSISSQPYLGLLNCKSVFLILKITQFGGPTRRVQLFSRYPCKNWYLHFYKTYDQQIWKAHTSRGFDLSNTNQAGAGDVLTSWSRDKLKTLYLDYLSAYGHQTWLDGNLPCWAPAHKVTLTFDHVVL